MNDDMVYLARNVVAEPLIDQWYAWAHLIPPATAARNIVGRHLKIMESYVAAPQVHAAAVKNPMLLGGPFVDLEGEPVDEVRQCIDWTRRERAPWLELDAAITALDQLLLAEATGMSLEPLYPRVPEPLRGRVELVYDLNGHPSFRLIEPLFYRSPLYEPSMQSFVLSPTTQDDRPFILSTPRLIGESDLQLKIPFANPAVDLMFSRTRTPGPAGELIDALGLDSSEAAAFRTLLTDQPPPPYQRYAGRGLRWRYFGHACILIEAAEATILLDPVLSYRYETDISRYTFEDLPDRIDYVLITHNHQDHIMLETMLQLRHRIGTVVVPRSGGGKLQDPSLRLLLEAIGFSSVVELAEMQTIREGRVEITGLPFLGEHGDLDIPTKLAYHMRIGERTVLAAADSCNIEPELYRHLHRALGDVDVLFLGMECDGAPMSWIYGPLLTRPLARRFDQSRRLAGSNFEQAIDIVTAMGCRQVYVYAMGQEPWLRYVMSKVYTEESQPIVASNRLVSRCRAQGMPSERLFGEKEILLD